MSIATRFPKSWAVAGFDIKDPSLILYLPLWSPYSDMAGSTIYSYDTNRLTGTVTGATWGSKGRTFDGTDDMIAVTVPNIPVGSSDRTIEAWVRVKDMAAVYCIFDYGTSANYQAMRGIVGSGFQLSTYNQSSTMSADLPLNVFHYCVFTLSGASWEIYTDLTKISGTFANTPNTDGTALRLGLNLADGQDWNDVIGEFRIYNRVLPLSEILHNYQATKWRYV